MEMIEMCIMSGKRWDTPARDTTIVFVSAEPDG